MMKTKREAMAAGIVRGAMFTGHPPNHDLWRVASCHTECNYWLSIIGFRFGPLIEAAIFVVCAEQRVVLEG
jgi:hypothetical protein